MLLICPIEGRYGRIRELRRIVNFNTPRIFVEEMRKLDCGSATMDREEEESMMGEARVFIKDFEFVGIHRPCHAAPLRSTSSDTYRG